MRTHIQINKYATINCYYKLVLNVNKTTTENVVVVEVKMLFINLTRQNCRCQTILTQT